MREVFINLYDDCAIDIIVPARRIEKIKRGPRPSENYIDNGQWIEVEWTDKSLSPTHLSYDSEDRCDEVFEHFCEQLGIE